MTPLARFPFGRLYRDSLSSAPFGAAVHEGTRPAEDRLTAPICRPVAAAARPYEEWQLQHPVQPSLTASRPVDIRVADQTVSVSSPSLRRATLRDLDEAALRALIDEGEQGMVEFKERLPTPPRFGAAAASFGNTLGGWIVIGVRDADRAIVGWTELNPKTDVQSHLGALLRAG